MKKKEERSWKDEVGPIKEVVFDNNLENQHECHVMVT